MSTPSLQARLPDSGISPSLLASCALLHSEHGLSFKFLFIFACFPLSLALQKLPKDPNDTQLPSSPGTRNLVRFLSHRCTAVPAQRVDSQACHLRRGENLGAIDFCQQEDEMPTFY